LRRAKKLEKSVKIRKKKLADFLYKKIKKPMKII